MQARSLHYAIARILTTAFAGIAVRFFPMGLPTFIVKYAGSMLWALMIYWIISAVCVSWHPAMSALTSGLVATAIEFFKLYRSPSLDAFRLTLPGVLLLGRFFSVWDIVAYWIAICAGAAFDWNSRGRMIVRSPASFPRTPLD